MQNSRLEKLQARFMVDDVTSLCSDYLEEDQPKLYLGVDPTSSSLHLGNLQGFVIAKFLAQMGCDVTILIGMFTAAVGDPSGKTTERIPIDKKQLEINGEKITSWVKRFMGENVRIVNNAQWLSSVSLKEYLRDFGSFFRMGPMLGKDWIKRRIQSENGMSYTEFSYQVLQAFDFLHLFQEQNVKLQIGGSDQWGNITAGCDLIRKKKGAVSYGLTWPLLTKSDGTKFGKTEKGAIWLDEEHLSAADFYQQIIQLPDDIVKGCFLKLTFLPLDEIDNLFNTFHPKQLQEKLAEELTVMLHGKKGLESALEKKSFLSMPGEVSSLEILLKHCNRINVAGEDTIGLLLVDICVRLRLTDNKSECRRLMISKGFYLNGSRVEDPQFILKSDHLYFGKFLFIKLGKKEYQALEII